MKSSIQITPENLPNAYCEGREEALEYIYDHYADALYGIINKMVDDRELGRDLLQESFVKIWHKRAQYSPKRGSLFTWMLNLTRNHCIDYLRSKRGKNQQKNRGLDNFVYGLESASGFNPDNIGLKKVLEILPQEQREVIWWSYFEGYTQSEIAEEQNLPLGTVKSRAKAAMDKLRAYFKNDNSP